MVPVERYCLRCGAACDSHEAACAACGASLKVTLPLDDEVDDRYPLTRLTDALPENFLLNGRYRIVRKVGGGGFGAVYEAEDITEKRRVALKAISLLGPTPQHVSEATGAFKREVELLSSLKHPAIPRMYEQLIESEHWYLVMEFIAGETLEERLARADNGYLPLEQALKLAIQLCDALEYLHSRQPAIIFRDLKPANIMLTPAQQLYVIDFGVARQYRPGKLKDTIAFGSPGYAAPEQYGRAQTTPRSDIYSLGATLHQMVTGQDPSLSPFRFQPLSAFDRKIPADLEKLVAQMLETNMEHRPANVNEVQRRLQSIAASRIISRRRSTPARGSAAHSRKPLVSAADLARAFSTVGVTVYLYREHAAPVNALAWSPDGSSIASCDDDRVIAIWGAFHSGPVHALPIRHEAPVNDLAWSPDGKTLATASDDYTVWLWGLDAHPRWWQILAFSFGFRTTVCKDPAPMNALSWSPDGSKIVTAQTKSALLIWDTRTGKCVQTYQSHGRGADDVAWAPDGLRIASCHADCTVQVWDAKTAKTLWRWHAKGGSIVHALAWSPDARYLACGTSKGQVHVWDVLQERQAYIYQGHRAAINSVAWSPDGQRIVSASNDDTVHLWRALDGKEAFIYRSHQDRVLTVAWSPDGQHVASAGRDGIVHVWKAV